MAVRLSRTPAARADLIEIWRYIADDNEAAADRVLDRVEAVLRTLSHNPLMGRQRPELAPDIRSFPVGRYVLFYRHESGQITLVRVLNGALDIEAGEFDVES